MGLLLSTDTLFPLPGSTARFSEDGVYRYELSRRWAKGPMAAFVMLNPSTADAMKLDPTIRRCRRFAMEWGMGGLYVANLFALRSTDPRALKAVGDPVGPENDDAIHDAAVRSRVVVCAWGAHPMARKRAEDVLEVLRSLPGERLRCLGTTKGGHPRHPLYVSSATQLVPYGT